jgi:hypothetical protein
MPAVLIGAAIRSVVGSLSSAVGGTVLWVCRRLEASVAMTFALDESPMHCADDSSPRKWPKS